MSKMLQDEELNSYRDLVQPPGYFEDGFTWRAIIGTVFVALVMLPAAMYMHLMIGGMSLAPAARWVTVILFLEMAKRARSFLKPAEIYILFGMIGLLVAHSPMEGFFWRQYLVQSDAVQSFGLADKFPAWWAPSDQTILDQRTFFHSAWFLPMLLLFLHQMVGKIDSMVLGYGLFRVVSDVERLPFPMATMQASGILAVTEDATDKQGWRWRCFSIAASIGMVFGFVYIGIPTITSTFMDTPFQVLPIPWLETSKATQEWFPATATGISFDIGHFFIGMALPFFAVVGGFVGLVITMVLNPYLYDWGILTTWQKGETTVQILFENNLDFYLSFGIGISIAIFALGIYQIVRSVQSRKAKTLDVVVVDKKQLSRGISRGDIRPIFIILTYFISCSFYILLCGWLLDWDFSGHYFLVVLLFFSFVYIPIISYVTARLEGLAGQVLALPLVREVAFILSGYKGITIWLLPVPLTANYGIDTVNYRVAELVGCSFRSYWKMAIITIPIIFISSLIYGNFIWGMAPIPSAPYPFAQEMWDLHARNTMLTMSATSSGFSPFMHALRWEFIAAGAVAGLGTYMVLAFFGLPILLLYGTVKGLGQSIPQTLITEFAGALFGRFIMERKFGTKRWRQYALVLSAGFACGTGLLMMVATGIKFLQSAVFNLPY